MNPQNNSYTATSHPSRKIRRTTHAGHCWRNKYELISNILLWTPSYGRSKVGRPAKTYVQQLCSDRGYSLEDLPGAMDDRDGWREGAREIRAGCVTCCVMLGCFHFPPVFLTFPSSFFSFFRLFSFLFLSSFLASVSNSKYLEVIFYFFCRIF